MELIDYDALEQYAVEYQERHKGDELTRREFKLIDNFMFECPKTEAIPVEWLKAQESSYTGDVSDIGKSVQNGTIKNLIRKWQKEQEAR